MEFTPEEQAEIDAFDAKQKKKKAKQEAATTEDLPKVKLPEQKATTTIFTPEEQAELDAFDAGPEADPFSGTGRQIMRAEGLDEASRAYVDRYTKPPGTTTFFDPESADAAQERAQLTKDASRTVTGERVGMMGTLLDYAIESSGVKKGDITINEDDDFATRTIKYVVNPQLTREGKAGTAASLLPQVISDEEQTKALTAAEESAEKTARAQFAYQLYRESARAKEAGNDDLAKYKREAGDLLRSDDPLKEVKTDATMHLAIRARRNELLASNDPELWKLESNPLDAYKDKDNFVSTLAKTAGMAIIEPALTTTTPGGMTIESPTMQFGRALGAPVSAIVAAGEAVVTDKDISETVPERLRGGMGVMGAGIDMANSGMDALEEATGGKLPEGVRKTGVYIGGGAGLVVDFMLPVFPGASQVGAVAKGGMAGLKGAKALGVGRGAAVTAGMIGDYSQLRVLLGDPGPSLGPGLRPVLITEFAAKNVDVATPIIAHLDEVAIAKTLGFEPPPAPPGLIDDAKRLGLKIDDKQWVDSFVKSRETYLNRAVLDKGLDATQKTELANASAVSTKLNRAEVDLLIKKEVKKQGGDLTPDQIKFVSDRELAKLSDKLVPDSPAHQAYVRQVLQTSGIELLEASESVVFPTLGRYTRVSPVSLVPERSVKMLTGRMKELGFNQIGKDILSGKIKLTDNKFIVPEKIVDRINRSGLEFFDEVLKKDTLISLQDWNKFVSTSTDSIASTMPGYMNIFDAQNLGRARKAKGAEFLYADYTSKVLTPKEVASGTIQNIAKAQIAKLKGKTPVNSLADELGKAITDRWGAMGEEFKMLHKQNRAIEGLTPADAWSKTVIENYKGDLDAYFVDYITQSLGGHESLAKLLDTTDGTKVLRTTKIPPSEIRDLAHMIVNTDEMAEVFDLMKIAASQEKWTEVNSLMLKAHDSLTGKSIGELVKVDDLPSLITKAEKSGKYTAPKLSTGRYTEGQRGLKEMLERGGEQQLVYGAEDHIELLSSQYFSKRQSDIIDEVTSSRLAGSPLALPSKIEIDKLVSGFKGRVLDAMELNTPARKTTTVPGATIKQEQAVGIQLVSDETLVADRLLRSERRVEQLYKAILEDTLVQSGKTPNTDRIVAELFPLKNKERKIAEALLAKDGFFRGVANTDAYLETISPALIFNEGKDFQNSISTSIIAGLERNAGYGPMAKIEKLGGSFEDIGPLKANLREGANIERFSETMEGLAKTEAGRKKAVNAIEVSLKGDYQPVNNRLIHYVSKAFGGDGDYINRIMSFAKGGMLGGQTLLPNLRFLMTNFLTGPAIIYGTLGPRAAAVAFKAGFESLGYMPGAKILLGESNTVSTMKYYMGGSVGSKMPDVENLFVTPAGKVYTNKMMADLIGSSGITRSQASAELTTNMMREMVSYSGREVRRLKALGEITEVEIVGVKRVLKELLSDEGSGALGASGLGRKADSGIQGGGFLRQDLGGELGGRQMNVWSELANHTDVHYRTSIVIDALKRGISETDAIRLGRESLFDYGKLSNFEKNYISKFIWFWNFRRNSLGNFAKNVLDNPNRIRNTYNANRLIEGDTESHIKTRDYTESRAMWKLIEDKETRQRYGIYGPAIPMLDAMAEMIDYLSLITLAVDFFGDIDKSMTKEEKLNMYMDESLDYTVGQMNPFIKIIPQAVFGVDPDRKGRPLSGYLDPKFMYYMQQNERVWQVFNSIVNLEAVDLSKEYPGAPTYMGRQWVIADEASKKRMMGIENIMMMVGIQRTLRDYAPLFNEIRSTGLESDVEAVQMKEPVLSTLGIVTPVTEPTVGEQKEANKASVKYELIGRTK